MNRGLLLLLVQEVSYPDLFTLFQDVYDLGRALYILLCLILGVLFFIVMRLK